MDLLGCVGFLTGDILIMTGTFQEHMQHKTLSREEAMLDIATVRCSYPAVNKRAVQSMSQTQEQLPHARERMVMTWRRIENHEQKPGLRCPMNTPVQEIVNPFQPMSGKAWKPPATSCPPPLVPPQCVVELVEATTDKSRDVVNDSVFSAEEKPGSMPTGVSTATSVSVPLSGDVVNDNMFSAEEKPSSMPMEAINWFN